MKDKLKILIEIKNFLFVASIKRTELSFALTTLIDLAYENELDPRDYLEFLLEDVKDKGFAALLSRPNFCKKTKLNKGGEISHRGCEVTPPIICELERYRFYKIEII